MSKHAQKQGGIISVWTGRVRFYYYFYKRHYVKALAQLNLDKFCAPELVSKVLWAYYQLGMYGIVCGFNYAGNHWRGQFARIVCFAATGEVEQSAIALNAFKLNKTYKLKQKRLAEALSPFSTSLALQVLQNPNSHPLLYAALLLKEGNSEVAENIIQSLDYESHQALTPEIYLMKNNIRGLSPAQRLQNINEFLGFFDLASLRLKQPELPPVVTNIALANESLAVMDGPLVSVLMTAYNSGEYIAEAIESILGQTYQNLELIIVDDASNDNTLDVIRKIAARDRRVKFFQLPCNAGTYVAKTFGLQFAKGEFITCHDSDDWSHSMRIQLQIQPLIEDANLVATISDWVRLNEDGVPYARGVLPIMRLNPASPLFRKSTVLKKIGSWDLVRTGADSEFIHRLKLIFGDDRVKRIRQPLTFGAHRPGSLMTASYSGYFEGNKDNKRLDYWGAWRQWHISSLQKGEMLFMSNTTDSHRPFEVPKELQVDSNIINLCLNHG